MMFANLQPRDGTTWANFTTAKDAGGDFGSGDGPDSSAEVGRIPRGAVTVRNNDIGELNVVRPDQQEPCCWAADSAQLPHFFARHDALKVSIGIDTYTQATRQQLQALFNALKPVPDLTLHWNDPDQEAVLALAELRNITQLQLVNKNFEQTNAMCLALSNLKNLVSLSLIGEPSEKTRFWNKQFSHSQHHEPFEHMGMEALAKLPNLRDLMLAMKLWIPDDGLEYFSESPLQSLSLACTVPSQEGITAISNIAGLRHLDLSRCHTLGLDFSGFSKLENLIKLDLRGEISWSYQHDLSYLCATPPTEHLADILEIPNLEELVLNGMDKSTVLDIVRAGLEAGKLPQLRTLNIGATEYSRNQLVSP